MAVTPTYSRVLQGDSTMGPWRAKIFQVSLTGTYVTGGFAIAPTDIGIGHNLFGITLMQVIAQATVGSTGAIFDVSYVAGNLALITTAGAEVGSGVNMAGAVYQLIAFGY